MRLNISTKLTRIQMGKGRVEFTCTLELQIEKALYKQRQEGKQELLLDTDKSLMHYI